MGPFHRKTSCDGRPWNNYAFVHFSLNAYTDQSGFGNEDINLFNPKELDCRQWARICKESGMKGIIITSQAPQRFLSLAIQIHCVFGKKCTKGDIVREIADACKEYGLKLSIYLSPWDRNHSDYGRPEYITYFRNQLTPQPLH